MIPSFKIGLRRKIISDIYWKRFQYRQRRWIGGE